MKQKNRNTDIRTLCWIWALIGLGCLLIFHNYILGNETLVFADVGSDTKEQYIMQYNTIVNHLREGSFSLWDFNNGFGVNMFITNLMEPFLWIVYLCGVLFGPDKITLVMVYVIILEILLAGTTCYFFLSEYSLEERAKLPACLMYAFNGYLMVWGQHYQLGSVVVFLPLLLMFLERMHRRKTAFFGAALLSAVVILNGFYQGYMCMLGIGIYVVLRELLYEEARWKEKAKNFFLAAAAMGFGVLMGAVNLLPSAAAQIAETSRLNTKVPLLQKVLENMVLWPKEYYKTLAYRFFGSNLQNSNGNFSGHFNYYEAANLFFSTLFIILLVQYLFSVHRQQKTFLQKAAQYLGVLICIFALTVQAGSLAFNGFAYAFARHTFLMMPFFALMSAYILQRIFREKKLSVSALAVSVLAIAVIYGNAYRNIDGINEKTNAFVLCLSGFVMAAALFAAVKWKKADKKICYQVLLLALCVNILSDTTLCFRYRDTLKKNDAEYYGGTYGGSVQAALSWIEQQDDSFYRVEKDFYTASGCMDGMAQNYAGVGTYNSTQNRNIVRFVRRLWPQITFGYDESHYKFPNTVREQTMAALTGIKYVLSRSGDLQVDGYELLHQEGDIFIYRNTETDSIGKFFTKTVTKKEFVDSKNTDSWELLRDVLIVDQEDAYHISAEELAAYDKRQAALFDRDRVDTSICTLTKNGMTADDQHFLYLPLKQEALEGYESASVEFTLEVDQGTPIEIRMNDERSHVRYQYAGKEKYRFAIPKGTEQITIQITNGQIHAVLDQLRFYGVEEKTEFSDAAVISLDAPRKDSELHGQIHAETDGMVMLAIPYQTGWSIYLNGEEQTPVIGDIGFMAFEVAAGDYELELRFRAPMFAAGAGISLVSWIVFVLLWICSCRRNKILFVKKEGKTNDRV